MILLYKLQLSMKEFLGFENKDENDSCFPSLSYKERIIGFGICFGLGTLIQVLSFGSFAGVFIGRPDKFAMLYTFGNIVSLFG